MNNLLDKLNLLEISTYVSIEPLAWSSIAVCLLSAGIIGLERQIQGKPIGIRTSILICLGTYIFMTIGAFVSNESADPSRVIGQIITGIGFLGAGVILAKEGNVIGVTSAACIWMLAAIGVVIGADHPFIGIKLALLTVFILVGVTYLEATFKKLRRGVHRPQILTYRRKKANKNCPDEDMIEDEIEG